MFEGKGTTSQTLGFLEARDSDGRQGLRGQSAEAKEYDGRERESSGRFHRLPESSTTSYSVLGVAGELVLRGIADKTLALLGKGHVRRSDTVTLVVGDDFHTAVLKNTDTKGGGVGEKWGKGGKPCQHGARKEKAMRRW